MLAVAVGTAFFASSCDQAKPPRYVVTHIGNSNAILTNSETGETWVLSSEADKVYWRPISKITN